MISVEIADTPYKQQQGLMFRKYLPENNGMLFKFDKPQILKFWGLNTYLPLDVAFINKENKIVKIGRIKPLSMSTVGSDSECVMALEANEGYFGRNGIKEGDEININNDVENTIIMFKR